MSTTTVNTGWIKDDNGEKFAPMTLSSQVITGDGISIDAAINGLNTNNDDKEFKEILIHTITADEAQAREITFTNSAYPDIKDLELIHISILHPETTTYYFSVWCGNTEIAFPNQSGNTTRVILDKDKGYWFAGMECLTNKLNHSFLKAGISVRAINNGTTTNYEQTDRFKKWQPFDYIKLSSYTTWLAEGAQIIIHGK